MSAFPQHAKSSESMRWKIEMAFFEFSPSPSTPLNMLAAIWKRAVNRQPGSRAGDS